MKSNKHLSFIGLIALTTLLSGCNFLNIFTSESSSESEFVYSEESEYIPANANYYRDSYSKFTYGDLGQSNIYASRYQPAVGNVKLLVIPVVIKGFEPSSRGGLRSKIQKAFFGTSRDTGWESVSSYFSKSSYGRCNITGEVTDWFEIGLTPKEIISKELLNAYDCGTTYVLNKAVEWAKNQGYNMKDYDLNKDGFIDAVWLVYSAPTNGKYYYSNRSVQELMWAFTYWDYTNHDKGNLNKPVPNSYAWASYDWIEDSSHINIDAHTYIHEQGHVFGLEDYYDYDDLHTPFGGLDMQDYNIGDHNAYSKYALGWLNPYYLTGECEIKIRSSALSKDAIVVKNPNSNWNHHAYDEYLMIEYLTPEGNWALDSQTSIGSREFTTYSKPGVRIAHVDARLYDSSNNFAANIEKDDLYTHAYSNTPSSSVKKGTSLLREDLLALIPADNDLNYQKKFQNPATDSVLFKEGMSFTMEKYSSFFRNNKLHDGTTIPYEITVKEMTDDYAIISFELL